MFADGLAGCTLKCVLVRVGSMSDQVPAEHTASSCAAGTGGHGKDLTPGCGNRLGKAQKHQGSERSPCATSHSLCISSCLMLTV